MLFIVVIGPAGLSSSMPLPEFVSSLQEIIAGLLADASRTQFKLPVLLSSVLLDIAYAPGQYIHLDMRYYHSL
jgi:hypothetical protein